MGKPRSTQTPKPAPKAHASHTPAAPAKRALPAALARNAAASAATRKARLLAEGRAAIALIRERRDNITDHFFDIGAALVTLRGKDMFAALGYTSFDDLCRKELELSPSRADQLIAVASRMERDVVRSLQTVERASAILALVDATPEDDTPADVMNAKLLLPDGKTLDVAHADTIAIEAAAQQFRRRRGTSTGKRSRGFTPPPALRAQFDAFTARLPKSGAGAGAKLSLVATRAADGADVVVRIPASRLHAFATWLAAKKNPFA